MKKLRVILLGCLVGTTFVAHGEVVAEISGKYLTTGKQTQYSKRAYQLRDYFEVTKEEYEHHAWATINGLLSANESGFFMKKIGEKKLGSRFNRTAHGSVKMALKTRSFLPMEIGMHCRLIVCFILKQTMRRVLIL